MESEKFVLGQTRQLLILLHFRGVEMMQNPRGRELLEICWGGTTTKTIDRLFGLNRDRGDWDEGVIKIGERYRVCRRSSGK